MTTDSEDPWPFMGTTDNDKLTPVQLDAIEEIEGTAYQLGQLFQIVTKGKTDSEFTDLFSRVWTALEGKVMDHVNGFE